MSKRIVAYTTFAIIGLAVTGCGLFRGEQREAWRGQAEQACLSQKLVQPSAYMSRSSAVDGPGACGMDYPFKVSAFSGGAVGLQRQQLLACPIIPRVEGWLEETVRPAARLYFGAELTELRAGSYACRGRNNQRGARLSEHSFGNAMDIMAFRLSDGREITVAKGWRGTPEEQDFLREVFVGACQTFSTVLGPGSDAFHYDHFHIDLARHNPQGTRRICKPVLKFTPRLGAESSPVAALPAPSVMRSAPVLSAPVRTAPVPAPLPEDVPLEEGEEDVSQTSSPAHSYSPAYTPSLQSLSRPIY
jgi:hypothetical protein